MERGAIQAGIKLATLGSAMLIASSAFAQTLYRYVDDRGKIYYSDKPLVDMTGKQNDHLSKQGTVLRRNAAALTPAERAAAEEERRKRAEIEKAQSIEQRRNLALLATYSSEQEIFEAQAFALREPLAIVRETEAKLATAERRLVTLKADVERLAGKPIPSQLRDDLTNADLATKSLQDILATKRSDVQLITDRYEEDKRRYAEFAKNRAAMLMNAQQQGAGKR
jgi:hypothetical protein